MTEDGRELDENGMLKGWWTPKRDQTKQEKIMGKSKYSQD